VPVKELRRVLLDGIDEVHKEYDGETPEHVILPQSIESDVRLEVLADSREYSVSRVHGKGLLGMQVWFSSALDERGKTALLLSDEVFSQLFERTKDFYSGDPYYYT